MEQVLDVQAALATAQAVRAIGADAKRALIQRDAAIELVEVGLMCGEHIILLGAPGTAKSSMVRAFAESMDLRFFRRVLNPDTTREDLVGPINPAALREGRWERAWAGLAKCEMALVDEIGKASDQVSNMLLDAMEERRVTSGDIDMAIPLHLMIAGTNETLGASLEAVWDRFTLRMVVKAIDGAADFARLLTDSWACPTSRPVTGAELANCRAVALDMAGKAPADVVNKLVRLWSEHSSKSGERISDRRWKRVLVVAAGHALLYGRTAIEVEDLIVCQHMLWATVDEIDTIQQWVEGAVNEEIAAFRATEALVVELEADAGKNGMTLESRARISLRAGKLERDIRSRRGERWQALRDRIQTVQDSVVGG